MNNSNDDIINDIDDIRNKVEQKFLKEKEIIKTNEETYKLSIKCKYSEMQVLEAQQKNALAEMNEFYNKRITPTINSILCLVYGIVNLVYILVTYILRKQESMIFTSIIVIFLMAVLLLVIRIIDKKPKKIKKNKKKKKKKKGKKFCDNAIIVCLEEFTQDTTILVYLITTLGYIITVMDGWKFWLAYCITAASYIIAIIFDIIKPYIREKNKHTVCCRSEKRWMLLEYLKQ